MNCTACGIETANPKFCSRSCSARITGSLYPKRKKKVWLCISCGVETSSRRKYCGACYGTQCRVDYSSRTLAEYKNVAGSRNSYQTIVRAHARSIARAAGKLDSCLECGYTHQVDCCHVKPVADFSEDATLAVVNAVDNLVGLCPNHHWELDNL